MASVNVIKPAVDGQSCPPIVAELRAIFDSLDDSRLIEALIGPTRRGPKGHSVKALWNCFVAKHALSLPSTRELIRTLGNNPYIREACGLTAVPHEATFSRFFAKLASNRVLPRVKDISRSMASKHLQTLPGFGKRVALDSTTLRGWSNGGKPKKSDKDAGWSIKKGTHGRKEFTFGYKLHLLVDCEYELPMVATVSAGNVHDYKKAKTVLCEAKNYVKGFHPDYVMADQGYSGRSLLSFVNRQVRATPIIQVNKTHKGLMSMMGEFQGTPSWKALYNQRQAVERVFSRLKMRRSLKDIKVRGIRKVTAHCYLSLIAMQALAVQ